MSDRRGQWERGRPWLAALAACAALLAPTVARADQFGGPLTSRGGELRDPAGRMVVMHGLMGVWKQAPYVPSGEDLEGPVPTFTESDADVVRGLGLDSMRLAWFWQGLEPEPGEFSQSYLDDLAGVESKLADRGIYSILDSHQDQYDKVFGDKPGLPEWTVPLTDSPDGPLYEGLPVAPDPSAPGYSSWKFPLGYFQPSTARAFHRLYSNATVAGIGGVRDRFGQAWAHLASRFEDRPMVAGYDLMNEPWPADASGAVAACQTKDGCPAWDREVLQPYYESLASAVRSVDAIRPVFFEPTIFFNSGAANHFVAPPASLGPVGLSFHDQCSLRTPYSLTKNWELVEKGWEDCPPEDARTMANAVAGAGRLGGPALMTEVAAPADDDARGLNCLFERSDYNGVGFTYGLSWSNPGKELRRLGTDSAPDGRAPFKRLVLARVYPRAIAGTPLDYRFDVRTGRFSMTVKPDPSIDAPTLISVPAGVQYPAGYSVRVSGGWIESAPGSEVLAVRARRGAGRLQVVVAPAGEDPVSRPDWPACVMTPGQEERPEPAFRPDPRLAKVVSILPRTRARLRGRPLRVRIRCARACEARAIVRRAGRPARIAAGRGRRGAAGALVVRARGARLARLLRRGGASLRVDVAVGAPHESTVEMRRRLRVVSRSR